MRKRILCLILTIVALMGMAIAPVSASDDITVKIDGRTIYFDVAARIINDRTMVPMRAIFEELGYDVIWFDYDKHITAIGEYEIRMRVGDNSIFRDGTILYSDVAPVIINDRTLIPLRALSETIGYDVEWDGYEHLVTITTTNDDNNYDDYDYDEDENTPEPTIKPTKAPTPKPTRKPTPEPVVTEEPVITSAPDEDYEYSPLGSMSALLSDVDSIGDSFGKVGTDSLTDNYGNSYSYAYYSKGSSTFETLLDGKYDNFKATIYVPKGCNSNDIAKVIIKADGKVIYTSPEITKISRPIDIDIDISGCNDFEIEIGKGWNLGYIGDARFYTGYDEYEYYDDNSPSAQIPSSALLSAVDSIGNSFGKVGTDSLTDNYGNSYSYAYYSKGSSTFETLLDGKYDNFKATIYAPKGCRSNDTAKVVIKADGKVIYTSPEITKTSRPIDVDIDISGCNVFEIEIGKGWNLGYIGDAEFYN